MRSPTKELATSVLDQTLADLQGQGVRHDTLSMLLFEHALKAAINSKENVADIEKIHLMGSLLLLKTYRDTLDETLAELEELFPSLKDYRVP